MTSTLSRRDIQHLHSLLKAANEAGQLTIGARTDDLPSIGGKCLTFETWTDVEDVDPPGGRRDELHIYLDPSALPYLTSGAAHDAAEMFRRPGR